ncbi:GNAT family N-acetyltransferase [Rhodococcoides fascians]|uniref:GNAT family N-acetyltransferase n=1 Tax=Rhodococcoides fascians TaxID=1828 RepID=UPI00050C023C|nr:hypothetical protein [Rhodococcus fascians]
MYEKSAPDFPRLLLDTNIVIAHENDGPEPHLYAEAADTLVQLARHLGFELLLSNGTRSDFVNAPAGIRHTRLRTLQKYYRVLDRVPEDPRIRQQFPSDLSGNNAADLEVLSTYATGFATVLVTEDTVMRKRAARAGLTNVFDIDDAIDWLRELRDPTLHNAASADIVPAYRINRHADLFTSLRNDYAPFDHWWSDKVVRKDRPAIILGSPMAPDGLAVLKDESDAFGLGEHILKVCTFKVQDSSGSGRARRGELLLRAVIDYAAARRYPVMYLTVWPKHEKLISWLQQFGFTEHASTEEGELVMAKHRLPPPGQTPLAPLEHAVRYGPRSLRVEEAHVVPIRHHYHDRLLPDSDDQGSLFENEPCGNAIRKAYLCRSNTRLLEPGHLLAFLRTKPDEQARITAVGVVEQTLVSTRPSQIAAFVRGRTVYDYQEIDRMCSEGSVLAVLFRLDTRISPPWPASTLRTAGVMSVSPQSIARVPKKGITWIRSQLDA